MSNAEIIAMQNTIISNMAQINADLHERLLQYSEVAKCEVMENPAAISKLESDTKKLLFCLSDCGVFEEGGNP
jgi:hypothetical protein